MELGRCADGDRYRRRFRGQPFHVLKKLGTVRCSTASGAMICAMDQPKSLNKPSATLAYGRLREEMLKLAPGAKYSSNDILFLP